MKRDELETYMADVRHGRRRGGEPKPWACPRCGYETLCDWFVGGLSHQCPEDRGRLVALRRAKAEPASLFPVAEEDAK